MLRVSNIMTRDVIAVAPDLGLRDAMELFVKEHVSGAPVVEGRKVIGVVSLTDLVSAAASLPGERSARDEEVMGAADDDSIDPYEFGDGPPAAYFSDVWEGRQDEVADMTDGDQTPAWNGLADRTVRDAMNTGVLHLPPDADVTQAAAFMQKHGVHRVLIMEDQVMLGILTTSDIARAVSEHRVSERRFVFGKPQLREDGSWW